jgi:hypothetical protein
VERLAPDTLPDSVMVPTDSRICQVPHLHALPATLQPLVANRYESPFTERLILSLTDAGRSIARSGYALSGEGWSTEFWILVAEDASIHASLLGLGRTDAARAEH